MNIPRRVTINKRRWKITLDDTKFNTKLYSGLCVHSDLEILVDPKLSRNDKAETLLHELLHAAFPRRVCNDKREEKVVMALAAALWPVLPKLYQPSVKPRQRKQKNNRKHRRIK